MSDPGYYIITDEQGTATYFHKWRGAFVLRDVFWGYDVVREFIDPWLQVDEMRSWIGGYWPSGIAIINSLEKRLLIWSDGLEQCPVVRKVYMAWLALAWPGWQVRWAYHGMDKILRSIGERSEEVIIGDQCERKAERETLVPSGKGTWWNTLVTVRWGKDQQDNYVFGDYLWSILCAEAGVLDIIREKAPMEVPTGIICYFTSTLFIDVPNKEVHYWNVVTGKGDREHAERHWPQWEVTEHDEGLFRHCQLAGYPWERYLPAEREVIERLEDMLLDRTPWGSKLVLSLEEEKEWLDRIISEWKQQGNAYEASLKQSDGI
jgi:hypothetical protein